jgi:hypothetical protein
VHPIFQRLVLIGVPSEGTSRPRVWWCPTGPLTFLPLHAAGPYTRGGGPDTSKRVVSSYTSTLGALLRAQSMSPQYQGTQIGVVAMTETPRQAPLRKASAEIDIICKRAQSRGVSVSILKDGQATKFNVLVMIKGVHCVHFACHGAQDQQSPLESALYFKMGHSIYPQSHQTDYLMRTLRFFQLAIPQVAQTPDASGSEFTSCRI